MYVNFTCPQTGQHVTAAHVEAQNEDASIEVSGCAWCNNHHTLQPKDCRMFDTYQQTNPAICGLQLAAA